MNVADCVSVIALSHIVPSRAFLQDIWTDEMVAQTGLRRAELDTHPEDRTYARAVSVEFKMGCTLLSGHPCDIEVD